MEQDRLFAGKEGKGKNKNIQFVLTSPDQESHRQFWGEKPALFQNILHRTPNDLCSNQVNGFSGLTKKTSQTPTDAAG